MMRLLALVTTAVALQLTPIEQQTKHLSRRDVGAAALIAALAPVSVLAQDWSHEIDSVASSGVGADRNFMVESREKIEPQQYAPADKLDVNAAPVTDYKMFEGLYPRVAGKIASNGPYGSVKDVYKVLDKTETRAFRQHEQHFVALPPGRQFIERINQRQSL